MDPERLKRDVERIEKHREEKAAVAKSEREIFAALKSDGFNCKVVREILKRRDMEDSEGWDAEVATYEAAVQTLELAAEAVRGGATYEEASEAFAVRKADLHHIIVATGGVPETDNQEQLPPHDPTTGEVIETRSAPVEHVAAPQGTYSPETKSLTQPEGDERVSNTGTNAESCGSGEHHAATSTGTPVELAPRDAGVAPGPQDPIDDGMDIPRFLDGRKHADGATPDPI